MRVSVWPRLRACSVGGLCARAALRVDVGTKAIVCECVMLSFNMQERKELFALFDVKCPCDVANNITFSAHIARATKKSRRG